MNKTITGKGFSFSNLKIGHRLGLQIGSLGLLLIGMALVGFIVLAGVESRLENIYASRIVPIQRVAAVQRDTLENRALLLEAILHNQADPKVNIDAVKKKIKTITSNWREAKQVMTSGKEKQLIQDYESARNSFGMNNIMPTMDSLKIHDFDEAKMTEEMTAEEYKPVASSIASIVDYQLKAAETEISAAIMTYSRLRIILIIGAVFVLAISGTLAWLTIRSITKPLGKAVALANRVAEGDLTADIGASHSDEIGDLVRSLKRMNTKLNEIVSDVRDRSTSIHTAAEEIAAGNLDLSNRTEEQASSLEETASSMEQMTAAVKHSAENASVANQLAEAAQEEAKKGALSITHTIGAMDEIEESSNKIANIIGVIDEIAFQTNLLALNAAVEAARAGEAGRGFAVVATEVRNLAQRSAGAAKEIKGLINESVDRVRVGSDMVESSGTTLAAIVGSVQKVSDIVAEITAASHEQSVGIDQVNQAIAKMDEMTQQNAALVEQAAATSHSMEDQSQGLNAVMEYFKLSSSGGVADVTSHTDTPGKANAKVIELATKKEKAENPSSTSVSAHSKTGTEDGDWEEF